MDLESWCLLGLEDWCAATLDASPALPYWSHVTTAYFTSVNNSGNLTYTIQSVHYYSVNRQEREASFGRYEMLETAVDLPLIYTDLLPQPPKTGDILSINGVSYYIKHTSQRLIWYLKCHLILPQLEASRTMTMQFMQASCAGSSSNMERIVAFTATGSAIQANIQPLDQELADLFHVKATPETYAIHLNADLSGNNGPGTVKAGSYLKDSNNYIYEILKVKDRERLDELVCCLCKRKLN